MDTPSPAREHRPPLAERISPSLLVAAIGGAVALVACTGLVVGGARRSVARQRRITHVPSAAVTDIAPVHGSAPVDPPARQVQTASIAVTERPEVAAEPREERAPSVACMSIDELLATHMRAPAPRERAAPAFATPSRRDVLSGMRSVQRAVRACGRGAAGIARVLVVLSGASGRVSSVEVRAPTLPSPVRNCVARAVRRARVPPFRQPSFRVDYPFRL